eukprot:Rmarinus@m.5646
MTHPATSAAEIIHSEAYKAFRNSVSRNKICVDIGTDLEWTFFDCGRRDKPPLVCLPGASGTAECFYKQMLALSARGYRVIAAQYPAYYKHDDFIVGMDRFLDHMQVHKAHLYGVSLGGFLAQVYAESRPERVASLVLTNSYIDTTFFRRKYTGMFAWMPEFYLKKLLLESFPQGVLDMETAQAVNFMVSQLESLSGDDIAARLTLNCKSRTIGLLPLLPDRITIINTLDRTALPVPLREQLHERYSKSRFALLKDGGDFPFLCRSNEVNMHLQVHLRHCENAQDGL